MRSRGSGERSVNRTWWGKPMQLPCKTNFNFLLPCVLFLCVVTWQNGFSLPPIPLGGSVSSSLLWKDVCHLWHGVESSQTMTTSFSTSNWDSLVDLLKPNVFVAWNFVSPLTSHWQQAWWCLFFGEKNCILLWLFSTSRTRAIMDCKAPLDG